jgi:hypothetical protein
MCLVFLALNLPLRTLYNVVSNDILNNVNTYKIVLEFYLLSLCLLSHDGHEYSFRTLVMQYSFPTSTLRRYQTQDPPRLQTFSCEKECVLESRKYGSIRCSIHDCEVHSVDLWVMTPCSLVLYYQRFRGTYCLHLPNKWWKECVPK